MEQVILSIGIALCLFALWALLRQDWPRLMRPSRKVEAVVSGHEQGWDSGRPLYAMRLHFQAEGCEHEVTDQVWRRKPTPPVGTKLMVRFPEGCPEMARVPRPAMWAFVYGCIVLMGGMLLAKALGLLGG
ncbi:DUF3592 domain-containing protein [Novosphingobium sp. ERW19]|uniref:DUF3592 domain-containing protein n=1 Tax=Novosphingobium sp. ERW19 TaxID=2726186 RepID=UPI0014570886|nr:DUF3592 domain-containing protein [Novosphingobium sp. ERW19]NLR39613.1 hypothetical protein [Novosphingobium sp. ERW19]